MPLALGEPIISASAAASVIAGILSATSAIGARRGVSNLGIMAAQNA